MKAFVLISLIGAALATSANAAPDTLRELARTGSTITVHGFVDGQ